MGAFADGLRDFCTKGIKGPHVKLTKKRARILRDMIRDLESGTSNYPEFKQDDYCATLQWLSNQIYKRYSPADLAID